MASSNHTLMRTRATEARSPHNRVIAFLLCLIFGVFGVHRFYVGKFFTGLLLLITGGGFGFWWLIDLFIILLGRFKDAEGRVLGPPKYVHEPLPATRQAAMPAPQKPRELAEPEPEEKEFEFDDEVMRDPLEDEFAKLEEEMKQKRSH